MLPLARALFVVGLFLSLLGAPARSDGDWLSRRRGSLSERPVQRSLQNGRSNHSNEPPKRPRTMTNAERFARGLPPNPPRKLFGKQARASPVRQTGTFLIAVYDSSGQIGYVGAALSDHRDY
ncbi:hypothetical protein M407DRAFT_6031 [Tulasnella calospora MUT 4182]|uniref:Uncharacterized protein n=1 Tax=Tulasnella calospora MUT 4182 TaxID=1051891 RepID=A0A0C3L7A7_9AGAM|nr:hypothetical protein M407DRAFT_6031 [Tulasnella calospora MUT 4182]